VLEQDPGRLGDVGEPDLGSGAGPTPCVQQERGTRQDRRSEELASGGDSQSNVLLQRMTLELACAGFDTRAALSNFGIQPKRLCCPYFNRVGLETAAIPSPAGKYA
jgi:hypothetical protein